TCVLPTFPVLLRMHPPKPPRTQRNQGRRGQAPTLLATIAMAPCTCDSQDHGNAGTSTPVLSPRQPSCGCFCGPGRSGGTNGCRPPEKSACWTAGKSGVGSPLPGVPES
ncbi:dna primase, partial [Nannochloropsis gaditana CCMP526]|uniref:dna primase n=1 Tax=Nannochloropsis gaditana (strain CCMP526) TaxID=1093141 RepID=UPI00029F5BA5